MIIVCRSGKTMFTSQAAAAASRKARRNKGHRMRVYLCDDCHCWHLTTKVDGKPMRAR